MLFTSKRLTVLAALFGLTISLAAITARAGDDVPNPAYTAWASFKEGSSATLSCDMKVGPNAIEVHIDMTRKLVDVKPEAVTVESTTATTAMGHANNPVPTKQTFQATAPAKDVKETGTEDVMAAGKTYKCKVIEMTGAAAAANANRPGSRPGAAAVNAKATLYVNKDVPGGVVKMEITGGDGKIMTFLLTALEVK